MGMVWLAKNELLIWFQMSCFLKVCWLKAWFLFQCFSAIPNCHTPSTSNIGRAASEPTRSLVRKHVASSPHSESLHALLAWTLWTVWACSNLLKHLWHRSRYAAIAGKLQAVSAGHPDQTYPPSGSFGRSWHRRCPGPTCYSFATPLPQSSQLLQRPRCKQRVCRRGPLHCGLFGQNGRRPCLPTPPPPWDALCAWHAPQTKHASTWGAWWIPTSPELVCWNPHLTYSRTMLANVLHPGPAAGGIAEEDALRWHVHLRRHTTIFTCSTQALLAPLH